MIDERLIDALNDCIDRLAAGESVEACLSHYPDLAADLRPMLEAGLAIRRVGYPVVEIDMARDRVRQRMRGLFGPSSLSRGWLFGLILLSLFLGTIVGSSVTVISRPMPTNAPPGTVPILIVTATPANIPLTNTPTPQQTVTPTLTATSPSRTTAPSIQPTITTIPDDTVLITIEGPVTAVNNNVITIFDQSLIFPRETSALAVPRLGDTIRVQAQRRDGAFVVFSVTFISVEVLIDGDRVWRDSGTCENPPPTWVQEMDGGTEWLLRCTGSSTSGGSDGEGSRGDSNDDDD